MPDFLDVLHDPKFQNSVREIKYITQFDTPRLANLWQLCRMSDPDGNILEAGVHRGGTALHLMNCHAAARFIFADTFSGVDAEEVTSRLLGKTRRVMILAGNFPCSDEDRAVRDISFAHIDLVTYQSACAALHYVAARCRPDAIIVVNDCLRYHWGVTEALCEFLDAHREWLALPLYPGQAVMVRRDGTLRFDRLGRAPELPERATRHNMPRFGTKGDPAPHLN